MDVQELAQKLYEDDGYSGNIYKKASINQLRHYENKAVDIIRADRASNKEPSWVHLQTSVLRRA